MDTTTETRSLRVLLLEPYYGGSHRSFLEGLRQLPFEFELMQLPPRKWKWRMRLAAPYFAENLHRTGKRFDRILCSTYVDVAAFRGLAPAWTREVPVLTYFHENQFAYPVRVDDERDFHFGITNLTTALSSDGLAFNSAHNLNSFLEGIEKMLRLSPDLKLEDPCGLIRAKAEILPPGMDFSDIDGTREGQGQDTPVILWNHRWEHDKNPEAFFRALFELDQEGLHFEVVVLGQAYRRQPSVFEEARQRLAHRLLHFGYVPSRRDYAQWLKRSDIVLSTARHEFFGMAVIEAVRAGCRPLLPRRLSYPELFPPEFLYDEEDLLRRLRQALHSEGPIPADQARALTEPFSWNTLSSAYETWLSRQRP